MLGSFVFRCRKEWVTRDWGWVIRKWREKVLGKEAQAEAVVASGKEDCA